MLHYANDDKFTVLTTSLNQKVVIQETHNPEHKIDCTRKEFCSLMEILEELLTDIEEG